MPMVRGTRLGAYEIVALIGSGGMGEVYRAHDPRLDRDVAIKVLPAAFSADGDRLRRFEQEARAAAALNHPNILTVHEVGTSTIAPDAPATPYVVSELLEGQTLRDALAAGPLPIRKVCDYAAQIAGGLAAAHERGVVHRDLKPENLFITRDGRVKILDFGLAKLRESDAPVAAGASTMLATRQLGTGIGIVLGTAGYMSPEQVRALPVDHRTDIFSFGAVLYEMITGVRAFRGETAADTASAILRSDPPELTTPHSSVPPALERIVHHCLEKTPELRFQAARDIVFNLEALSSPSSTTGSVGVAPPARPTRTYAALALAAALAVAAGAAATWKFAAGARTTPTFRQVTFRHGALSNARFTADGQNIVYTAAWEDAPPEVFIVPAGETGGRSLEVKNAALLAVSKAGEVALALNPTALSVFVTPGTLARGTMTGGAPKAQIENILAADYTHDGSALAIVRVLTAERVCQVEFPIDTVLYRGPYLSNLRFSPDGKYLAFIEHPSAGDDRGKVVVIRADGTKVITGPLRDSHRGLVWSPSGDEVWTTAPLMNGVLQAIDLRGRTRDVLDVPGKLLIEDVAADGRILASEGTMRRGIIVVSQNGERARDLSWLDYSYVRAISDDGEMILFEEEAARGYRTFVRNVDGSPAIEIGSGYGVALSPDKASALSLQLPESGPELWLNPIGAGQPRRLSPAGFKVLLPQAQFFADGKRIAVAAREGNGPTRTYILPLDGGTPRAIGPEGVNGGSFISPDQKWIAALSPSGPLLVATDGGAAVPIRGVQRGDSIRGWTSDGQLYVASGTNQVLRIDRLDPHTGTRTSWRQAPAPVIVGVKSGMPFITPDGRSFAYGYNLGSSDFYVVTGVR